MKESRRAMGIPPVGGQGIEMGDLIGVDGGGGGGVPSWG